MAENEADKTKKVLKRKLAFKERNYFPTSNKFRLTKILEVIKFFQKWENNPFTKEQVRKQGDVKDIEGVFKRIISFCWKNRIIFSYQSGDKYKVKDEFFSFIKENPDKIEEAIKREIKTCKGYKIIYSFITDEKLHSVFLLDTFKDYLNQKKIGYNDTGLLAWFNFLNSINLVDYNIQTKKVKVIEKESSQDLEDAIDETEEVTEKESVESNYEINKPIITEKAKDSTNKVAIITIRGNLIGNADYTVEDLEDFEDFKDILQILERRLKRKTNKEE